MSVAETSRAAYKAIEPKLGKRQMEVLEVIQRVGPVSNQEVASFLKRPINQITGRSNELAQLQKIEVAYTAPGEYGHSVKYWKAIEEPEQLDLVKILERDCGA